VRRTAIGLDPCHARRIPEAISRALRETPGSRELGRGSRIYPNGQGIRASTRPAFGVPVDDNAVLPAARDNFLEVSEVSAELL
jgi:hypothetical protein